jgi:hypothetical protein
VIKNLTPHALNLIVGEKTVVVAPSGLAPRVTMTPTADGTVTVDGIEIPIVRTVAGEVTDLPAQEQGVLLVVSRVVAEAARGRTDLVVPDDLVRDAKGQILGARRLARV